MQFKVPQHESLAASEKSPDYVALEQKEKTIKLQFYFYREKTSIFICLCIPLNLKRLHWIFICRYRRYLQGRHLS
jgi:hypothetical protein